MNNNVNNNNKNNNKNKETKTIIKSLWGGGGDIIL